jgi:HAD superfamily hydrolase (TIGR01450 family)
VTALLNRFDALLFDLDGVVYVGPDAVPHAAESIATARAAGLSCGFVTNNAARSAEAVAAHLVELGVDAASDDVITSPQAAVSVLPQFVPPGARVLVIGGPGIREALAAAGYEPVRTLAEDPAAVMQGFSPDLTWRDLAEATFAVRAGLPWIATNPDLTFPAPGGIAPGNGALVRLVAETAGRLPDAIAGKPEPPLLREAIARLGAERPLMVGDRLDTDIAAGTRVQIPTLLVLTGVTTVSEILAAIPEERPTYLGPDLRTLTRPYPQVRRTGAGAVACGEAIASTEGGVLRVRVGADPWDGLRAAAVVAWSAADQGSSLDLGPVTAELTQALTVRLT